MAFFLTTMIDGQTWYFGEGWWTRRRDQARQFATTIEAARAREHAVTVQEMRLEVEAAAPA